MKDNYFKMGKSQIIRPSQSFHFYVFCYGISYSYRNSRLEYILCNNINSLSSVLDAITFLICILYLPTMFLLLVLPKLFYDIVTFERYAILFLASLFCETVNKSVISVLLIKKYNILRSRLIFYLRKYILNS